MPNNIVTVSVNQQVASAPIMLQQTGAIISQGATTLTPGTTQLLTQVSDMTPILSNSIALSSLTWASNIVTGTTVSAHGIPNGQSVLATIAGVTPSGYNGKFLVTSIGADTFTYALTMNPGSVTVEGTFILADVAQLNAQVRTFFAQGAQTPVYILELGVGDTAYGVTALTTYIDSPTIQFYSYLLPAEWDTESTMQALALLFVGTTAVTYFYVTTTVNTYTNWEHLKSVLTMVQSPNAPVTEFSMAAMFWEELTDNPNASNQLRPMSFRFVSAVTPYSTLTGPQQTALNAAGVNWINTGAEGQISNTIIQGGKYMDLKPYTYWYAVDWVNTHQHVALAAAVINGSNNPTNPLKYNQDGINALQVVAQNIMDNGTAFGVLLAGSEVDAVPFTTYIAQNPSDYSVGTYNGLSCTFVPARGFEHITIYLTASDIPQ